MSQDKLYDQIEDYLNGNMSEEEKARFSEMIQRDPNLVKEVDLHSSLKDFSINRPGLKEFNQTIAEIKSEPRTAKPKNINYRKVLSIAASILILGSLATWIFSSSSSDKIYSNNFQPPSYFLQSSSNVDRGETSDNINMDLTQTNVYFEQKQYDKALDNLNSINHPEWTFHKAIINMVKEDWQEAIALFDQSKEQRPEASAWYQGLCYLKINQFKKTQELIQPLTSYDNPYRGRATEIVKWINNL